MTPSLSGLGIDPRWSSITSSSPMEREESHKNDKEAWKAKSEASQAAVCTNEVLETYLLPYVYKVSRNQVIHRLLILESAHCVFISKSNKCVKKWTMDLKIGHSSKSFLLFLGDLWPTELQSTRLSRITNSLWAQITFVMRFKSHFDIIS